MTTGPALRAWMSELNIGTRKLSAMAHVPRSRILEILAGKREPPAPELAMIVWVIGGNKFKISVDNSNDCCYLQHMEETPMTQAMEARFMEMLNEANPLEQYAVIEALRQFVRDYDGKPQQPCAPGQACVNVIKRFAWAA